jgi:predicted nucleotidyltransferase
VSAAGSPAVADLPPPAARALEDFVSSCREAFGDRLRAVVLYGSGAEGRLRPTSDLNVIVVLRAFSQPEVDRLREGLRLAQAAARLAPMFLLEDEIPEAVRAFAAKFADVLHRRRVVHGDDPFAGVTIPREVEIARLRQVLLNLVLRLRALYALRSLREEQLALVLADAAGPLRSCAALLLELEGQGTLPPKEALARLAEAAGREFAEAVARLSRAREERRLPPGAAGPALFRLIELAESMRSRARALS